MLGHDTISSQPIAATITPTGKVLSAAVGVAVSLPLLAIGAARNIAVASVPTLRRALQRGLSVAALGAAEITSALAVSFDVSPIALSTVTSKVAALTRSTTLAGSVHARRVIAAAFIATQSAVIAATHGFLLLLAVAVDTSTTMLKRIDRRLGVVVPLLQSVLAKPRRMMRLAVVELQDTARALVLAGTLQTLDPEIFHTIQEPRLYLVSAVRESDTITLPVAARRDTFSVTPRGNVFSVARNPDFGVYGVDTLQDPAPRQRT